MLPGESARGRVGKRRLMLPLSRSGFGGDMGLLEGRGSVEVGGETGVSRDVVLAVVALESELRRVARVWDSGVIVASDGSVERVSDGRVLMVVIEGIVDIESENLRPSPSEFCAKAPGDEDDSTLRRMGTDRAGLSTRYASSLRSWSGGGTPRRPGETGAELGTE